MLDLYIHGRPADVIYILLQEKANAIGSYIGAKFLIIYIVIRSSSTSSLLSSRGI